MVRNKLRMQLALDLRNYSKLRKIKHKSKKLYCNKLVTLLTSRGLWLIIFHRIQKDVLAFYTEKKGLNAIIIRLFFTFLDFLIQIITKSYLHHKMPLDRNVYLSNKGNMIVGARKIGSGSVLQENITIGQNIITDGDNNLPSIGRNVWIGSNSIIYGIIFIGDGVTICENTVLSRSIPANCIVKGNPAKVIMRNFDNSLLRMDPTMPSEYIIKNNLSTCLKK